jgi:hypothetical protein
MKKLEELLNLPASKEIIKQEEKKKQKEMKDQAQPFLRSADELDRISASLPPVKGLGDAADAEFDALAQRATDAYDDLMDLGMNVEARYSSRIFEVAGGMLKNAIDAKSAKIDKKLKMIELQLKKQAQDLKNNLGDDGGSVVEGKAFIVSDRNSLLQKLKNIDK